MEAYVFNHAAQSNAVHGRVGRLMFVMSHFDSTVDGLLNLIAALQETGGNLETGISRGLTSQQIDALPLVKVTRAQHQLTLNCAVCLEDYHLDEAVKELPCKHVFHPNCIANWLKNRKNCPVCRGQIVGESTPNNGADAPLPQGLQYVRLPRRNGVSIWMRAVNLNSNMQPPRQSRRVRIAARSARMYASAVPARRVPATSSRAVRANLSPLTNEASRQPVTARRHPRPTVGQRSAQDQTTDRRITRSLSRRMQNDTQRQQ